MANRVAEPGDAETESLDLVGDFVYVPYLLADGERFFSSFAEVNPEGLDHVQSTEDGSFKFEDRIGGGDLDFNDFILAVEEI